jgi:hypothetical protein
MMRQAFVVIAGGRDEGARSFVDRYADRDTCLMTPRHLSQSGWNYRVGKAGHSTAMIGTSSLAAREIAGVLTRIPCVTAYDLPHIAPEDRNYVATEMTAFLLAWLTELECPIFNHPTPQCLSGPCWPHEKWVQTAARIGIPTASSRRRIRFSQESIGAARPECGGAMVTVVGGRHIGAVDGALGRAARALADAAGAELLTVRFSDRESGAHFLDASHWVDLRNNETAEAVLQSLRNAKR